MKLHFSALGFLLLMSLTTIAQKSGNELHFTSSQQQMITVYKGTVFVNSRKAFVFPEDIINYKSKRNRLIENSSSIFLFLEVNGSPNKNRLYVFKVEHSRADSVLSAISSDVKDFDQDDNLEFGGSELVPAHASPDSIYYTASRFYEIKKGKILFDAALTETTDKKINGIYIPDLFDSRGGYKAILKPKKRYGK